MPSCSLSTEDVLVRTLRSVADMRPFAQPWAKEVLKLKPHVDVDLVILDGDHDLDGHVGDAALSLTIYPAASP